MSENELKEAMDNLSKKFEDDKNILMKMFCTSNNPYAIGDKVTDHAGTIVIEKISYSLSYRFDTLPCCVYFGIEINKDGTPNKRGNKRQVWQRNIKQKK